MELQSRKPSPSALSPAAASQLLKMKLERVGRGEKSFHVRTKKAWDDFKVFLAKGNVIELAAAVVIGTAFTGAVELTHVELISAYSPSSPLHFS